MHMKNGIIVRNSVIYLEQAEQCASAAREAELVNVRDRFREAEKNWRALATLAINVERTALKALLAS
jgi:hypothetical protein